MPESAFLLLVPHCSDRGEDLDSDLQMRGKQATLTAMGMYQLGLYSVANNKRKKMTYDRNLFLSL